MKILLVNDEPNVREILRGMLAANEVQEAEDGDQALAFYEQRGPFDLVVTDVMHPGLNGIALLERIKLRMPCQAVLLVTAATPESIGDVLWRIHRVPTLHLPFEHSELEEAILLAERCATEGAGGVIQ